MYTGMADCQVLYDEEVTVKENLKLSPDLYRLSFDFPDLARTLQPGQFFQVQINKETDPFLRRPFTVYRIEGDTVQVLYEIVGKGSAILAEKQAGDWLKIMGPLGKPFSEDDGGRINVVIGGGLGIAPFIYLAQKIRVDHFLMGARTAQGLLPQSELGPLWDKRHYATNDGSEGVKGFVTECLKKVIEACPTPEKLYLYVCGPRPMMKAVIAMAKQYGVRGEASVDERMACGVGACLGCVVPTDKGYKTACQEGTVFTFEELRFE